MYLKPMPKKISIKEDEKFIIDYHSEIVLEGNCNFSDLEASKILQRDIEKMLLLKLNISKAYEENFKNNTIRIMKREGFEKEEYNLNITREYIELIASFDSGIFYGVQTLIQIIRNQGYDLNTLSIEDKPYFKNRGYYHDITRGKVPTLETLKELVDKLASYKINQLQLYIEHSFAFSGFTEIWCDKTPITAEEILILDDYCQKRHIELIPSISTFGHLYEMLRSESYKDLCELGEDSNEFSFFDRMAHHTLNISDEKSIKTVEEMIKEFLPLFSSSKFNIGCDETFDLCKGKSSKLLVDRSSGELYVDFLNKVVAIGKKHNKEILFWGDVILRYNDLLHKIDKDVTCLNWNYYYKVEESDTKKIYESGINQYVCPGVAGWNHLMNLMEKGYENISRMVSYGVKYGATGVLTTDWGDYGHLNLLTNSIPLMIHSAALSWNPKENLSEEQCFKGISLLEFNDKSGEIMKTLVELSNCQKVTWYEIVRWKEKKITLEDLEFINNIKALNPQDIREDYFRAKGLEGKIKGLSNIFSSSNALMFKEFLISAQGIALLNDFSLYLLKDNFEMDNSEPVNSQRDLAIAIEKWIYEYQLVWRERNKESELNRIIEVFKYMCKYLRGFK